MIYDVIIIWAWASWLFAGMNLDKKLSKLILEKTTKPWAKVLLSWGERANVSNMNIDIEKDYFSQNKKFLLSIFSQFNQWDTMSYFSGLWINLVEEDRGRLILESGNSRELLEVFLDKINNNNCKISYNQEVKDIIKLDDWNFEIITDLKQKYYSKNVIVSSWWKSFFQVWTTGEWYSIAENLWLNIITPYRWLCWLSTKKDLSFLSWISCESNLKLVDKKNNKIVYQENWPLLFTHFWLSWPIIFNISNAVWEYLNFIWIWGDDFEKYMLENLCLNLNFNINNLAKKIIKFFELSQDNSEIFLELQNWRSWKEAKVTWWWIDLNELDNHMQSKKYAWLYFVWELVDVTWKTWGYNLQWAWSSWFVVAKHIN